MNAKKIIIPIVIAAVVACGVGYYCYSTVKASTLSESTTSSSSTLVSSTISSGSANTNVDNSSTKAISANNETNTGTASNTSNTNAPTSSNTSKTIETTNSNNGSSSTKVTSSRNVSSTNGTSSKKVWVYKEGYVPSDYGYVLVRSEANSTSSVVTTLPTGAKFFVVSEYNDWAYIQAGNKSGYIAMWEITYTAPTSSTGNSSSNTSSQALSQLKETCLNQLSGINADVNKINESIDNENPTQYQVDESEGNIYQLWQGEVNEICYKLQETLPSNEFSKLQQEQSSWISTVNEDAKNYAQNYAGGGSDYLAVLYMKLGEYYKARCYYLVDTYM